MVRKAVIVRGRVQGVGFRWSAQAEAWRLGVTGFARNLPDGAVECEIQGTPDAVGSMLEWLYEGPSFARVRDVEVRDIPAVVESSFVVVY